MTVFGGDFSHFQADAEIPDNLDFYIHKATEGDNYVDPSFAARWQAWGQQGRIRGAYHFFRMSASVGSQVQWFMNHADIQIHDFIVVDFEDDNYDPWSAYSPSTVAGHATDLMNTLHGVYPNNRLLLYCNETTFTNYVFKYNIPRGDGMWIADYQKRPADPWILWQYNDAPFDKDLSDLFAHAADMRVWLSPQITLPGDDMFTALKVELDKGRAYATFECGLAANGGNSALVANAWAAAKALWGDVTGVRVVATDDAGNATVLADNVTIPMNHRLWWPMPNGASDVTLEWDPAKQTAGVTLDGYVIGK